MNFPLQTIYNFTKTNGTQSYNPILALLLLKMSLAKNFRHQLSSKYLVLQNLLFM